MNADAVQNLAQFVQENTWLIHYSTDYDDGCKQSPYVEDDTPNPITSMVNQWAGERAISKTDCQHLIFRTAWIIGMDGNNFAQKIIELAKKHDFLEVVNDQVESTFHR